MPLDASVDQTFSMTIVPSVSTSGCYAARFSDTIGPIADSSVGESIADWLDFVGSPVLKRELSGEPVVPQSKTGRSG
jgi:hypothetical protein